MDFDDILRRLTPVLIIDDHSMRAYHASFLDFLSHDTQCKNYYMMPEELNIIMAMGCLEIMKYGTRIHRQHLNQGEMSGLKFNICRLESSFLANNDVADLKHRMRKHISAELLYSSTFWFEHLYKAGISSSKPEEYENMTRMVTGKNLLCTERALFWLEIMSLSGKLPVARSVLVQMESKALVSSFWRPTNEM